MLGSSNSLRRNLLALFLASPWLFFAVVRGLALDRVWPLVPLVSFTPQAVLWMLLPLVLALLLRAKWMALVVLVAMLWMTALVAPRTISNDQPEAQGGTVQLLTANLLVGGASLDTLAQVVKDTDPDIVALQEVTPENVAALRRLGVMRSRPYVVGDPVPGTTGYITISRWKLTEIPGSELATGRWPAIRVSGVPLVFRNVHPAPPIKPDRIKPWQANLRSIPPPGRTPSVIAGDFNATLDHRDFRAVLARGYRDAGDQTGNGLKWTWDVTRNGRLVIDHVLVSRGIAVSDYVVHDVPGSDHNAVTVRLRLPG